VNRNASLFAQVTNALAKSPQAQFGHLADAVKVQLAPVGLPAWHGQATQIAQLASTLAKASAIELTSIANVLGPPRSPRVRRGLSDANATTISSPFSSGDAASWMERNQPLAIWLSTFIALLTLIVTAWMLCFTISQSHTAPGHVDQRSRSSDQPLPTPPSPSNVAHPRQCFQRS
jgi:hypothetical protein